MDSVVDPEPSGHCNGGTWRRGEMLAPKLRSRESRIIGLELVSSLGSAQRELLSLGRELERMSFSSILHSTQPWAHTGSHSWVFV